ncbi:unnamed protein product [Ilex paraguariensis]|uniref:Mitochondrial glycoprotein n=1 Tax=Ilex paraguariensis TaxID=185542 RepID=A0ABC8UWH4_9AQUA
MAFYSILRRASSTIVPLAVRSVGSPRTLYEPISTALGVGNCRLFHELSRRSLAPSIHYSTAFFAAKLCSSPDENLIQIIDSEIQCAQESDLHDCVVEIPDSFPFEIQDTPGESIVILKREYQDELIKIEIDLHKTGNEEIVDENDNINYDVADGDDNEEEKESNVESNIALLVSVSKRNGFCLQFDAGAFPDRIAINSLSIKEPGCSPLAYEGPEFSDLDENLQRAFHKYLAVRGLKPNTASFLLGYMISKDSKEYLRWLRNIKKFVEN